MTNADFVTDNLAVGGKESPLDHDGLRAAGITAILNVGRELDYPAPNGVTVAKVAMVDSGDNAPIALFTAVSTLTSLIANHRRVLVHCAAGGSRSVTVACCWLVLSGQHPTYAAALEHVKLGRKCASPNDALRALAETLLNDRPNLTTEAFAEAMNRFHETRYLARYPDVAKDVKPGGWNSGREHFIKCGFREGRRPN
ncbi:MAG: dual specificity protein phosphatase family protein [Patescibacteria group bacterium]|nr:dual specificity protein phosphatase family protein [Patescibacteria group bacterium]